MGFTIAQSQCLVAPPYAFAAVVMYVESWLGDKYRVRGPQILFNAVVAIIGLSLMGWTTTSGVRYFGVFLFCAPVQANVVMVMSFQANNIRGQWKRAFCSASLVGFGGIGKENQSPLLHPKKKNMILAYHQTNTNTFFSFSEYRRYCWLPRLSRTGSTGICSWFVGLHHCVFADHCHYLGPANSFLDPE